jgi:hypothetical protein
MLRRNPQGFACDRTKNGFLAGSHCEKLRPRFEARDTPRLETGIEANDTAGEIHFDALATQSDRTRILGEPAVDTRHRGTASQGIHDDGQLRCNNRTSFTLPTLVKT